METLVISRHVRHFHFAFVIFKNLFLTRTLTWRVNNLVSRKRRDITWETKAENFVIIL